MTKTQRNYNGPVLALSPAFLFGASTPIAKLLLGMTDPLLLAGLLYLGSGAGLAMVVTGGRLLGLGRSEAHCAHVTSSGLAQLFSSAHPRSGPAYVGPDA